MFNIYKTYNKAKEVFVKPRLKISFGLWKHMPGLPLYRYPNRILGYNLPLWLSFHFFDYDVMYKWKCDTIRFEYPPQITIVFFGFAIHLVLKPILEDKDDYDDFYWDSLLSYLYQPECERNITKTLNYCGKWGEPDKSNFFQLRKTHINPEYHEEYDMAVTNYKEIIE